jgi:hypothetical protein
MVPYSAGRLTRGYGNIRIRKNRRQEAADFVDWHGEVSITHKAVVTLGFQHTTLYSQAFAASCFMNSAKSRIPFSKFLSYFQGIVVTAILYDQYFRSIRLSAYKTRYLL